MDCSMSRPLGEVPNAEKLVEAVVECCGELARSVHLNMVKIVAVTCALVECEMSANQKLTWLKCHV